MQSSTQFNITFRGDIDTQASIHDVKAAFRDIFQATDSQLDKIFSGRVLTLMRGLSLSKAEAARQQLAAVGAITFITRASHHHAKPKHLSALELQAQSMKQALHNPIHMYAES